MVMKASESSPPSAPTSLSPEIAGLLQRIVNGWVPVLPELGSTDKVEWGGHDLSAVPSIVTIENGWLLLNYSFSTADVDREVAMPLIDVHHRLNRSPIKGDLKQGWSFTTEETLRDGPRISMRDDTTAVAGGLKAYRWRATSGRQPRFWITRITPVHAASMSRNLMIELGSGGFSPGNLCLRGAATYYLVNTSHPHASDRFLVIERDPEGPDALDAVRDDFLALQFVLGERLRPDTFIGLSENGDVEAAVGMQLGMGRLEDAPGCPLVPTSVREAWQAAFFTRLSQKLRDAPELRLYIPLALYADVLEEHLDGAYLKLHVGLEAFAERVVSTRAVGNDPLVKSLPDWKAWVASKRGEIESLAFSSAQADKLINKLNSAPEHATASIVKQAFDGFGVKLSKDLKDEIRYRDVVAHTALMVKDERDREIARDLERIAKVRSMMVALVALAVGYAGPVLGWELDEYGNPKDLSLDGWRLDPDVRTEALRRFEAGSPGSAFRAMIRGSEPVEE